jgi:low affinity Fe/Cu permease
MRPSLNQRFASFASAAAKMLGKPWAFMLALAVVLVWGITGPLFRYSDTWQLVINTGTTIVTFLMVFMIQNTQNRDGQAIQAKLDELIRASAAQNRYIGIEDLTDIELEELRQRCKVRGQREG